MISRDDQYRRLSHDRNRIRMMQHDSYAQVYYLSTRDHGTPWVFRLQSSDIEYLNQTGKDWQSMNCTEEYQVTPTRVG